GCTASREELYGPDDPRYSIPQLKKAAARSDPEALAMLVEALESHDAAVRLFAIEALERRTGHTLGFRYFDDDQRRRQAVALWREHLGGEPLASLARRAEELDAPRPAPSDGGPDGEPAPPPRTATGPNGPSRG